ncbi:PapB/FocB family fimbrial expression transcriptional regulator [Escherichia coli]|uniref:PapB/FocB family fimbrial expression transcriptional regulator n=1 Tax=Escherichia coli TaxID=562 RepID=UPI000AC3FAA2
MRYCPVVWLMSSIFCLYAYHPFVAKKVILAMRDYLVDGHSRKQICERYNMNNGYFSTTLNRIARINAMVVHLAPYYPEAPQAGECRGSR